MPQLVVRALRGPYQDACGCFSCGRLSCAEKRRYDALGCKPPAGSQLTETTYAIMACLESTRRCESAFVVCSRSMVSVIPKRGKVGFDSCRLVHGMCAFWKTWHRGLFLEGTWSELPSHCYGFQRARRSDGAVASHLALGARCRRKTSHFLMTVWTWQTLLDRWTENTEDVIQPRLREIDRFFFITRGRRLFTEVLAPDGIASGLAQVGLFDKNAPDEFGAVFQGAIDKWQASLTKKNGGIHGRSPYEDVERSCVVTLFAVQGTADECEHTVTRMGEVSSALETCGLRQNDAKLVILPNLRRTVENRKFSRSRSTT